MALIGAIIGSSLLGAAGTVGAAALASGNNDPFFNNPMETRREQLQAEVDYADDFLNNYINYQPRYAAVDWDIARQLLVGTPAGEAEQEYIEQEFVPGVQSLTGWNVPGRGFVGVNDPDITYDPNVDDYYLPGLGQRGPQWMSRVASPQYDETESYYKDVVKTRMVPTEAKEGMLEVMRRDILPQVDAMQTESATRQRAGEISDVQQLGPDAYKALRDYNPEQTAMRDALYQQRMEMLKAGGRLTPAELREREQAVRGAQAARGFGYGPTDIYSEAMQIGAAHDQRRLRNQALAAEQIAMDQGLYGDVFQQILGRGSGQTPLAQSFAGQASTINNTAGPKSFLPNDPLTADTAAYNANAANAARIAGNNRTAGLVGGGLDAAGNIFGSIFSNPNLFKKGT